MEPDIKQGNNISKAKPLIIEPNKEYLSLQKGPLVGTFITPTSPRDPIIRESLSQKVYGNYKKNDLLSN